MNALWQKVNREMVAKILAELEYERTLRAEWVSSDGWRITMGSESWQFRATRGIWGWLTTCSFSEDSTQAPRRTGTTVRSGICPCPRAIRLPSW